MLNQNEFTQSSKSKIDSNLPTKRKETKVKRFRNKKTFTPHELDDQSIIIEFMSEVLKLTDVELVKEKLLREQKRLYGPYKVPDVISIQSILNCIPRRYRMFKTNEANPVSVNTLINQNNTSTILMLTRSSHNNQRFVFAKNGSFKDTIDSSRLFVDIYWFIKKPRRKGIKK